MKLDGRKHQTDLQITAMLAGSGGDSIYIPCGDGKARRVGLRSSALADGLPAGVDRGGAAGVATHATNPLDLCIPILTTHEDGRAMLLKGYGNAIVPQAAAVFIRAYAGSAT
jgi:hypothetical protein